MTARTLVRGTSRCWRPNGNERILNELSPRTAVDFRSLSCVSLSH